MGRLLQGEALRKRAEKLGIECSGLEIRQSDSGQDSKVYEYELQQKVMAVERHIREHRLWVVALASAIASIVSAASVWYAIFFM